MLTYTGLTAFPVQIEEFGNNFPMAQELDGGERGCTFALLGTDSLRLVFQHSLVKRAWARFCLNRAPGTGYRAQGMVSSERTKGLCLSLEGHLVDAPNPLPRLS